MLINAILYYLFLSSSVLICGIGLKRIIISTNQTENQLLSYFKTLITVTLSGFLSWLIIRYLLIPSGMVELYPFICLFIVLTISVFCETLIRLTAHTSTAEISLSFLCVLFSVNESTSMLQSVINSSICLTSCYLFIPLLLVIRKRISYADPQKSFSHGSLVFFSLSIILLAFLALNVSWLTPGVIK